MFRQMTVTYRDNYVEQFVLPPGVGVNVLPDRIEVGTITIERAALRRWQVITPEPPPADPTQVDGDDGGIDL